MKTIVQPFLIFLIVFCPGIKMSSIPMVSEVVSYEEDRAGPKLKERSMMEMPMMKPMRQCSCSCGAPIVETECEREIVPLGCEICELGASASEASTAARFLRKQHLKAVTDMKFNRLKKKIQNAKCMHSKPCSRPCGPVEPEMCRKPHVDLTVVLPSECKNAPLGQVREVQSEYTMTAFDEPTRGRPPPPPYGPAAANFMQSGMNAVQQMEQYDVPRPPMYNQIPMGMGNMGMGNMGMNNMAMGNMGMNNMGTGSMGMNNMAMGNMGTNNMAMGSMGMNNMAMGNMGMNNMGMGGFGRSPEYGPSVPWMRSSFPSESNEERTIAVEEDQKDEEPRRSGDLPTNESKTSEEIFLEPLSLPLLPPEVAVPTMTTKKDDEPVFRFTSEETDGISMTPVDYDSETASKPSSASPDILWREAYLAASRAVASALNQTADTGSTETCVDSRRSPDEIPLRFIRDLS